MLYIICVTAATESQEHGEFSRKFTKDRSENSPGKGIIGAAIEFPEASTGRCRLG